MGGLYAVKVPFRGRPEASEFCQGRRWPTDYV